MATKYWIGGAVSIPEVKTITVGGSWANDDTLYVEINDRQLVLTAKTGALTVADICNQITAMINGDSVVDAEERSALGSAVGEFYSITAVAASTTVTLTGKSSGAPMGTVTVGKTSASGTISIADTTDGESPYHWDVAENWSDSVVPGTDDTVIFDYRGASSCKYGLDNSSLDLTALIIKDSFAYSIGLASINRDTSNLPYPEHRDQYLQLQTLDTLDIDSSGGGIVRINTGTDPTSIVIRGTGRGAGDGFPACSLICDDAATTLSITGGSVGLCVEDDVSGTVDSISISGALYPQVTVGKNVTVATISASSGTVFMNSAVTTANISGGTLKHFEGAITTLNITGGTVEMYSNATITSITQTAGTFDKSVDSRAQTISNYYVYSSCTIRDPLGSMTLSNGIDLYCQIAQVNFEMPSRRTWTLGDVDDQTVDGIIVAPGSDTDADLISVVVSGDPTLSWDESEDAFSSTHDISAPSLTLRELSADPSDPTEGQSTIWQSDGTGLGDDGDLLAKLTAAGVTIDTKLTDYIAIPCNVGGFNHVEIQAALDAGKRVVLDGNYYVNTTITIPPTGEIIGVPGAAITYYPSPLSASSAYVISVDETLGNQRTNPPIRNIKINCGYYGRGVHFDRTYYSPLYENLRIYQSYEVALDLVDCWGSNAGDLYTSQTHGICVRCWNANSVRLGMVYSTSSVQTNMPSATETEIQDGDANYVQTAANRQALIVIDQNCHGVTIDNLTIESSTFTTEELLSCDGSSCTINYIYAEANTCTDSLITCVGDGDREGAVLTINGGEIIDSTTADCLLDLTGTTHQVLVKRVLCLAANAFAEGLVRTTSGTHYDLKVEDCHVTGVPRIYNAGATLLYSDYDHVEAPAEVTDGDTAISTANLFNKLLYMTSSGSARNPVLPSGTTMNSVILDIGGFIEWTFINDGSQTVTINGTTGHTVVGTAAIPAGENATFITRISAANTAVTYRK